MIKQNRGVQTFLLILVFMLAGAIDADAGCSHLGNSVVCPSGVADGSTSQYFFNGGASIFWSDGSSTPAAGCCTALGSGSGSGGAGAASTNENTPSSAMGLLEINFPPTTPGAGPAGADIYGGPVLDMGQANTDYQAALKDKFKQAQQQYEKTPEGQAAKQRLERAIDEYNRVNQFPGGAVDVIPDSFLEDVEKAQQEYDNGFRDSQAFDEIKEEQRQFGLSQDARKLGSLLDDAPGDPNVSSAAVQDNAGNAGDNFDSIADDLAKIVVID